MRITSAAAALTASAAMFSCTLLVGTDGLTGGTSAVDSAKGDAAGSSDGSNADDSADSHPSDAAPIDPLPGNIKLASPALTSAFVSYNDPSPPPSTSVATTVQAGDLLVVGASWTYGTLLASPATVSVADSLGNTWQAATMVYDNYQIGPGSNPPRCKADAQIFYATPAKGGSDVVTITTSQPNNTTFGFTLLEYAGVVMSGPVEDFGGLATPPAGSNAISAPPLTVASPKAVVVAVFVDTAGGGQIAPGMGFSLRGSNAGLYSMVEDNLPGVGPGKHVAAANLPNAATDNCWAVAAAAFRAQ